jgi:hypothetical protein
VRGALRDAHRAALARGLRQLDLARHLCRLAARRGLRLLPIKGAALAEALYASPAERPMADVDLLALDAWPDTLRLASDAGLVPQERGDHALALVDPPTGLVVELHHALASCPALHPFDAERLWACSRPAGGLVGRIPSPEDLLVQLALHAAFQHGLGLTLVQYLDFRRLLERLAPATERVLAVAAALRAERSLAAALAAAEAVVGARIPSDLAGALERHVTPALGRFLALRLADPVTVLSPSCPPLARSRWLLARGRRLELLRATLAPPGPDGFERRTSLWRVACRASRLAWRHFLPRPAPPAQAQNATRCLL